MKTNSLTFIIAGVAAAWSSPAFALEAPEDNAPPPPALNAEADAPKLRFDPPGADEKKPQAAATAFLGVVTSDLPEMLAVHLNLKPGDGIVVRSLMPDGPAAKAGIATHDVITHVSGEAVHSPLDFSQLIGSKKPGDTVNIELIHKGKPAKIDVTLGTRPEGVAALEPQPLNPLDLGDMPRDLAERIRKAIEDNPAALQLQLDAQGGQLPKQLRDLQKQMQGGFFGEDAPQGNVEMRSGATFRMRDPEGSIEIKSNNGSKEVVIRDTEDNVTWSGPWDTEQDKAAAPEDVRKRIATLNLDPDFKGNGIRLKPRTLPLNEGEE